MGAIRAASEVTIQRLEVLDPVIRLAVVQRLLPPGYVVSSPERENCIAVLYALVENAIQSRQDGESSQPIT
jgi:hypothetical protein